jgi:O-antigen/teichoic acid export membrane protein
MAAGIIAIAPQFVPVFLGNQWEPVIPLMQSLAVWGGIRSFGANVGGVYKAVGKPDIEAKLQVVKVLIIALTIYPAAESFGVVGVASAIIGSSLFVIPSHMYIVLSITKTHVSKVLIRVGPPFAASVVMCAAVMALDLYILTGIGLPQFVLLVLVGVVIYATLMLLIEVKTRYNIRTTYETVRNSI